MAKAKLTRKQKRAYLDSSDPVCPFCGDKDILGGPVEVEGKLCIQEMGCVNCAAEWHDVYRLIDVVPD